MEEMKVLISGAGIAGPTLAWWLKRAGFAPTLIERSPELRTGGYIIDFWGAGFDVADRMGLLPALGEAGYLAREVRVVDGRGKRIAGFPVSAFERIAHGRYFSVARGDLAAAIFRSIDGVETIFGDSIARIEQSGDGVDVRFERGGTRRFDLLIGADGLHSRVRQLAFGEETRFEQYLGCKVAAFETDDYAPRDELVYVMYTEVGQQVSRFALRGNRTLFLFTWADADPQFPGDLAGQKKVLRARFGASGWECREILDRLDAAHELYFDRVSQIHMAEWTRGRVALLGDAAWCVSLLAGEGSSIGMAGAYMLAGELRRLDVAQALAAYEAKLRPFLERKKKAARRMIGFFAPRSPFSLFLRNRILDLLTVRWIADAAIGRDLADQIVLPDGSSR